MRTLAILWLLFSLLSTQLHAETSQFIGSKRCADCHQSAYQEWQGSHHDWAMREVTAQSVLGDFNDVDWSDSASSAHFFQRGNQYWVRTAGPKGKPTEYRIAYTFGVYPLQQYLIAFPNGHYQTLSIAWDSRPANEGGQRWFSLYPDQAIPFDDPLHWSGALQKWNSRCAECHSTGLKKNYNTADDSYQTIWSEINVACEACHGPGSKHLAWAEQNPSEGSDPQLLDLTQHNRWQFTPEQATAQRTTPHTPSAQIDTCANCHSRRSMIDALEPSEQLLDRTTPVLLEQGMYEADGQILDEVYVYGSFLQSKMHQQGVTCSNCHNPHTLELRAEGNGVCLQCHKAAEFDTPKHHHHPENSSGASCANCHMPETTYMVVDPRRDHSIRIPRPDLSVTFGTRNSCTDCHREQSAEWAVDQLKNWGVTPPQEHWAEQLTRGRQQGDSDSLLKLIDNSEVPDLVRATAMRELADMGSREALSSALRLLRSDSPWLRFGALQLIEQLAPAERLPLIWPLLDDPIKSIRLEATRLLNALPDSSLIASQRQALNAARSDYQQAQDFQADMPGSQTRKGDFYRQANQLEEAEQAYQQALRQQPSFLPALLNLADLKRSQGDDGHAAILLREALQHHADSPNAHHALGLLLIRQQQRSEALQHLEQAYQLAPNNPRFGYVLSVAEWDSQQRMQALQRLEQLHQEHPTERSILMALISYHRQLGNQAEAQHYYQRWQRLP